MTLQWRSQPGPASCSTAWQSVSIHLSSRYAELSTPRSTPTFSWPGILRAAKASPLVLVSSQQEDKTAHFGFQLQNLVKTNYIRQVLCFDKCNTSYLTQQYFVYVVSLFSICFCLVLSHKHSSHELERILWRDARTSSLMFPFHKISN